MSESYDQNFNAIIPIMLILSLIGVIWMAFNGVQAGIIYSLIFLGAVVGIAIIGYFSSEEPEHSLVSKILKPPFTKSLALGVLLYVSGWAVAIVFGLILRFLANYNITNFSIPLLGQEISSGVSQSFSAAQVQESMSWKIFTVVLTAGTVEEFAFDYAIPFIVVALIVLVYLGIKRDSTTTGRFLMDNKYIILVVGIKISSLLFMGSHALNDTYANKGDFLIAGLFKVVSLITIYINGLFMSFWVGYHQANNFMWLIDREGITAVFSGLFQGVGLIIPVIFLLSIGYLIFSWATIRTKLRI